METTSTIVSQSIFLFFFVLDYFMYYRLTVLFLISVVIQISFDFFLPPFDTQVVI